MPSCLHGLVRGRIQICVLAGFLSQSKSGLISAPLAPHIQATGMTYIAPSAEWELLGRAKLDYAMSWRSGLP